MQAAASPATATVNVKGPPQSTEGLGVTTAGAIAGGGVEISASNLQTNSGIVAPHQSQSPRPYDMTHDFSNDEEIGDWIYKNWHRTKRLE
jgi:hypothetical protein